MNLVIVFLVFFSICFCVCQVDKQRVKCPAYAKITESRDNCKAEKNTTCQFFLDVVNGIFNVNPNKEELEEIYQNNLKPVACIINDLKIANINVTDDKKLTIDLFPKENGWATIFKDIAHTDIKVLADITLEVGACVKDAVMSMTKINSANFREASMKVLQNFIICTIQKLNTCCDGELIDHMCGKE